MSTSRPVFSSRNVCMSSLSSIKYILCKCSYVLSLIQRGQYLTSSGSRCNRSAVSINSIPLLCSSPLPRLRRRGLRVGLRCPSRIPARGILSVCLSVSAHVASPTCAPRRASRCRCPACATRTLQTVVCAWVCYYLLVVVQFLAQTLTQFCVTLFADKTIPARIGFQ